LRKKNYNSLLPDDFELSEEFETIIDQLENTKEHFYITGKAGVNPPCWHTFDLLPKKIRLY
jgi:hypothetical protein